MDKWDYIKIIKSYEKSKRGYLLLGLLDRYDKNGLIDITK